ncbi:MAG: hypothetical protein ACFB4I_03725 [Cyanophyceae cyanobacterium]
MKIRPILLLAFLALFKLVLVDAQKAAAEAYVADFGDVQAELFYTCEEPGEQGSCLKPSSVLTIVREGKTRLQTTIADEYGQPLVTYEPATGFTVQDLDGDREPEVIADLYSGGVHCCTTSLVYRYDPAQKQYLLTEHHWQHSGYYLQDLNQDGVPEFISGDNRFVSQFASYADSGRPIQIWQFRSGEFIDVTRRFPQQIYRSAAQHWQRYQEAQAKGYELKGILAGYLATKYLLGEEEDGWQRIRQAYQAGDRERFFTQLRQFLQKAGYAS